MTPLAAISSYGIVPTVEIKDPQLAVPLARALLAGGLPVIEVTFRTEAAQDAVLRIAAEVAGVIVGAGTLITAADVVAAAQAGAVFGVSPGFARAASDQALELRLPFIPGCATATEAMNCLSAGHSLVKLFPSNTVGGVRAASALLEPLRTRGLQIMATGGITPENLGDYLRVAGIVACGGSWIAPVDAIDAQDWPAITERAAAAVAAVTAARGSARPAAVLSSADRVG